MNDPTHILPASEAAVGERATFLKKTYGLLLLGVLFFAASLWACGNVSPFQDWAIALWNTIHGSSLGWLLYIGLFFGGSMAVHALAEKHPINIVAFFGWSFLLALLIAPLVLYAASNTPEVLAQASLLTGVIFTGLTAYVMFTGKDFSFLRGILTMGFFVALGLVLAGWLFGFGLGLWLSGLIVALMAGFILYDTSNILHRYPTNMAVSAAVVLFTDVILLFKHLLILLMSLSND